ncbi:MAG: homocysteine S-methyltransferase family protein [Planctomycetota bacterium]|jgi:5-methyltetrahydrofolate--homocysteine methyltransferase|nr:homocysteine S-methyltransferase family protein [Planctomycetota bacterium]
MRRSEFRELAGKRVLVLDGATGTELFKCGLPPGVPPEGWILENPEIIRRLHRNYYAAGSDFVLACTFGANRIKLAHHGLAGAAADLNRRLVEISRRETPPGKFILGDISPTGQFVEPFGPLAFDEAAAIFREQAAALLAGGADGLFIETMMDIQEARAACLGAREAGPDTPILVSMTYEENGRTLGGTPPEAALVILQSLGADAVGCNCSSGPEGMLAHLERMLPLARVPVFIKPNAGLPRLVDGENRYEMAPEPFSEAVMRGVELGAGLVGGCCGTSPEHIRTLRRRLDRRGGTGPRPAGPAAVLASARRKLAFADPGGKLPLLMVGERINPTGKKAFQAELLSGDYSRVLTFAEEQEKSGAELLDVNLGLGGLDEAIALRRAVGMLAAASPLPLVIDTVDPAAMEAALRLYPGRALVNSVSGEQKRLEGILPLAAEYGAMIIVLPVGDGFIPAGAGDRLKVAEEIVGRAGEAGLGPADLLVDGVAMAVSADPLAALATLEFISLCRVRGWSTILGLSNVSFGMPDRKWINSAFLAMAMANGLNAAIVNPSSDLLREIKAAADLLAGRHEAATAYIEKFSRPPAGTADRGKGSPPPGGTGEASPEALAARAILKGNLKQAAELARKAIDAGVDAGRLVADSLVPAIVEAGELFERKIYYLPQLMLAGEAMRLALAEVEPDLAREREGGAAAADGRIVMATVRGDVHDIGKNLVSLMLRNHGYEVLDLGKDVPAAEIVRGIREHRAAIVGLSALMTTSLSAMREAIGMIRESCPGVGIVVGGAAVTRHFADEAGADGYSPDAVSAVRLAGEFLKGRG